MKVGVDAPARPITSSVHFPIQCKTSTLVGLSSLMRALNLSLSCVRKRLKRGG